MAYYEERQGREEPRAPDDQAVSFPPEGRKRVVIEEVRPAVECGSHPAKAIAGDPRTVEARVFADGHDRVRAVLCYRRAPAPYERASPGGHPKDRAFPERARREHQSGNAAESTATAALSQEWEERPMKPLGNDYYRGTFIPDQVGRYEVKVRGWIDRFATWQSGLGKKVDAGVDVTVELLTGGNLAAEAAEAAEAAATARDGEAAEDADRLAELSRIMLDTSLPEPARVDVARSTELERLVEAYLPRRFVSEYAPAVPVWADPPRARFSAWYEMFPRSTATDRLRHGTFHDTIELLPYVRRIGFDVLYLPPIHPIGRTKRKGRNNALIPAPDDPGSPWAIGSDEGGHTSVHPELGTIEDFDALVAAAREEGLEIALDIAFQCSPDHPWVKEHPEWFRARPDGTIQFAENPPKKYEDIYPLDFETEHWRELWSALRDVFLFWMDHGVRTFRVDNPHTKAFSFWEWCVGELRARDPEVVLLAEAFTRPAVKYRLGKLGFSQGYTYFAWRPTAHEMRAYVEELTTPPVVDIFRPNFWPNTPDILHEILQNGGRGAFIARLVLAATLSSNYGIYGPAFELMEHAPREPGSEEYLNSEKYEIRFWDRDAPYSLSRLIATVNAARNAHPALQRTDNVRFHNVDNDALLCYSKVSNDLQDVVLVVVTFDYRNEQMGWVEFSPAAVGLPHALPFVVRDLLTGEDFEWGDYWNFVKLDPYDRPAHILHLRRD